MIRASLIGFFLLFTVCSLCGKDFVSLGRHSWRCKSKIVYEDRTNSNGNTIPRIPIQKAGVTANISGVKCCCGKLCKGVRGLKAHQRSCRVTTGLNENLQNHLIEEVESGVEYDSVLDSDNTSDIIVDNSNLPAIKKE